MLVRIKYCQKIVAYHFVEYDKNYQLTKSISPNLPAENFSYDSLGNRSSDSNSTYLFDESKQLIKEDYKFQYVFDPNGNMTSKIEKGFTGNVENFDYTSENQLKTFRLYESGVLTKEVQYLHDALGRRIEKTVVNHKDNNKSYTKRFAYDGQEILFEMDGENTITKTYTHSTLRTDNVLGVAIENNSYFFLKDGLGTITDIVDSNGFVKQHYEYSAFGKLLKVEDGNGGDISASPVLEPYFTYTGREYDEETGLYYYRARYYDPALGRFLTADPDAGRLSNPITHINKYTYVGNNPVNNIDPSGRSIWGEIKSFASSPVGSTLINIALIGGAVAIGGPIGVGVLVGAAVGAGTYYLLTPASKRSWSGLMVSAVAGGVAGGIAGGLGASLGGWGSMGIAKGMGVGFLAGAAGQGTSLFMTNQDMTSKKSLIKIGISGVVGAIFGGFAAGFGGRGKVSDKAIEYGSSAVESETSTTSGQAVDWGEEQYNHCVKSGSCNLQPY